MDEDILQKGEKMLLPIDEKVDNKCYEINKIENWADCFYNLKSGIILERYKKIISKTENKKFFEGLNYEYGIYGYPLDTNKAFQIYKTAADTSTDTLSMYRLYRIYKKDFAKFNIKKRNLMLEKFYIMKCFAYLTSREKNEAQFLYKRFNIKKELYVQIVDSEDYVLEWCYEIFDFLYKNNKLYNISKDDVIFIEAVFFKKMLKRDDEVDFKYLCNLADKGHSEAMYNLNILYENKDKSFYMKNYKKLYIMNHYRSVSDYVKILDYDINSLIKVKKSILNGYYYHISSYMEIFLNIYNFEDIVKLPELRAEMMLIINFYIDNIIADEIEIFIFYVFMRKILIKHFNFGNEFKTYFDLYNKEIVKYLLKFVEGTDEENKKKIKLYFLDDDYFKEIYTKIGQMYFYGMSGIIEKNYDECLNKLNYLLKTNNYLNNDESSCLQFLYYIKRNQRKKNKNLEGDKKEINNNDNELIQLEKKLIKLHSEDMSLEKIKLYPPSSFYILSRFYNSYSINNEDLILEYVLLNRAANAPLLRIKEIIYDYFNENYYRYKAKKKIAEKNKEENFNKMKFTTGVINAGGYGDDGTICPICLDNKKSIICLPCKHFFCKPCLDKLIDKRNCPICRTEIKITFNFNLKKENLIKSILSKSNIYQ